jgi:predicted alpha/beta superfamily hydrolase
MTPADDARPAPPHTPTSFPGAVEFDVTSKINGRTYRVLVYQPLLPPPEAGYPAVFLSDGNMNFPIAAAMGAMFAFQGAPALIVGVGYPTTNPLDLMLMRTRDLTPPTPIEAIRPQPGLPPPVAENYGGDADFLSFLTEELRPLIAAQWPTHPARQTLYGFSLGGLFTLNALFARPSAFSVFVASSPSIWWHDRSLLAGEAAFSRRIEAGEAAPRVLITIGGEEQTLPRTLPPGFTEAEALELVTSARMVDNARELGARLAALKGADGYAARFHAFDGEDHLTAMAGSIARALDFALRP